MIIGAGPAGLTAGCELLRQSAEYDVMILEESEATGGISKTIQSRGNRMDLGGHRFFTKNRQVMDWWLELLPLQGAPSYDDKILGRESELSENGPDPEKEDRVFLKRQRISRIYYKNRFFDYPVKMNLATIRNLGFATTLEAGFSYLKVLLHKRPENSLEDFYINRFGSKLYQIFFADYTEKLWGRHPREISPDWGAQRVKGLSVLAVLKDILGKVVPGTERNVETSLIESFYYPKYGPGQMWEAAAEEFVRLGGELRTGCRVGGIRMEDGKQRIADVFVEENGSLRKETVDIVISSMPLKDLIGCMNHVPDSERRIAEGLPYRDFVTVGLLVKNLKLKNETSMKTLGGIIPDCWIYVQDKGVKLGRIQIFNNWSPYMVKEPEDTIWMGLEYFCTEGDRFWNMTNEEWMNFGKKELIQIGILDQDTEILEFHCEKVKKAYPAYFDTYKDISKLEHWLNGIENLYCIGRNGQHRYNNMDHSMLTAFEAVRVLLSGSADKSSIWKVNTEKEYHEENKGAGV